MHKSEDRWPLNSSSEEAEAMELSSFMLTHFVNDRQVDINGTYAAMSSTCLDIFAYLSKEEFDTISSDEGFRILHWANNDLLSRTYYDFKNDNTKALFLLKWTT